MRGAGVPLLENEGWLRSGRGGPEWNEWFSADHPGRASHKDACGAIFFPGAPPLLFNLTSHTLDTASCG